MASSQAPRKRDDYTVGIICPMGVELAAVKAMLDDTHPSLLSNRDMIKYTLGHIGGHNVVIAVLPEIGNSRAAQVALQLLNDFTQIRFGLLVGIGGGIPCEDNDIRLGDVVVSKPRGEFGGVVQWDMGKYHTSGRFERVGALKKPPMLLLTTIEDLQADYLQRGGKILAYLEDMDEKWPAMKANGFTFPGEQHDQCFDAAYTHNGGATCKGCDREKLVDRDPRPIPRIPRVFYGTIGSGNAVIKDGKIRERLRKDLGILCVEMEAAGLMDEFQCLVIRGVCDYADSHKNKIWQPYAAAVAAAYMKELLLAIPVKQVEAILTAGGTLASKYTNEIWNVPFSPPPVFVGRHGMYNDMKDRCSKYLDDKLAGHKTFVLYGLGGSGKTTLCVKFAWEFREKFWAVFWIHSNSEDSVQRNLREIGNKFASLKSDDHRSTIRWLSNLTKPWLLIFDNADDPYLDLSAYFPASDRGLIIVTSRNPDCARYSPSARQEVKEMQESEACDLLLESMGGQGDAAEALVVVKALGFLALPIIHAAAYLGKGLCTMNEYPDKLAKKRKAVLNYQRGQGSANYPHDTYASLEISATHIQSSAEKDPVAAHALQLLDIMAFWHFEGISESIIENACLGVQSLPVNPSPQDEKLFRLVGADTAQSAKMPPEYEQWWVSPSHRLSNAEGLNIFTASPQKEEVTPQSRTMSASGTSPVAISGIEGLAFITLGQKNGQWDWDSEPTREAFALLRSYSIISVQNRSYGHISIHPVTHSWMKDRMDETRLRNAFFSAVWILGASTMSPKILHHFRYEQSILPHIDSCLQGHVADFIAIAQQNRVIESVVGIFSLIYYDNGTYRSAAEILELWQKVLMKIERGVDHPQTGLLMLYLSKIYDRMGQHKDAIRLGELSCEVARRNFGEDDLRTIERKSQLGWSYNEVGELEKSIELQLQCFEALKARRKTSEASGLQMHVENRLGACYAKLGKYEKAIEMGLLAFEGYKQRFGEGDPNVLTQMSNLSGFYHRSGNLGKAMELQEECLEIRKRVLGENHPGTLTSMSNLALCYSDLGRRSEAEVLSERCLEAARRVLGEEHPFTLRVRRNRIRAHLRGLKIIEEVVKLGEECLEATKRILGEEHPDTLDSLCDQAEYYHQLGENEQALELAGKCWRSRCAKLGETHPDTVASREQYQSLRAVVEGN